MGFPNFQKNDLCLSLFSRFCYFTQTAEVSLRERRDSLDEDGNTEQHATLTSNTMRIWHTTGEYGQDSLFLDVWWQPRCVCVPAGLYANCLKKNKKKTLAYDYSWTHHIKWSKYDYFAYCVKHTGV